MLVVAAWPTIPAYFKTDKHFVEIWDFFYLIIELIDENIHIQRESSPYINNICPP